MSMPLPNGIFIAVQFTLRREKKKSIIKPHPLLLPLTNHGVLVSEYSLP